MSEFSVVFPLVFQGHRGHVGTGWGVGETCVTYMYKSSVSVHDLSRSSACPPDESNAMWLKNDSRPFLNLFSRPCGGYFICIFSNVQTPLEPKLHADGVQRMSLSAIAFVAPRTAPSTEELPSKSLWNENPSTRVLPPFSRWWNSSSDRFISLL